MLFTWGVETLRARLMHDIGDQNSCSWQLAAASFAQYDSLPTSLQTPEEAGKLLDRIELAAENLARHRRGRGKNKGGKNDRNDTAMLTGAFGDGGKSQRVCEDCGGDQLTKNCWNNAEKVLARREAAKARKAKKAGKSADSAHLTQLQKGPGDAGHPVQEQQNAQPNSPPASPGTAQPAATLTNVVAMLLENRLGRDKNLML